jgi:hypothetical protein
MDDVLEDQHDALGEIHVSRDHVERGHAIHPRPSQYEVGIGFWVVVVGTDGAGVHAPEKIAGTRRGDRSAFVAQTLAAIALRQVAVPRRRQPGSLGRGWRRA